MQSLWLDEAIEQANGLAGIIQFAKSCGVYSIEKAITVQDLIDGRKWWQDEIRWYADQGWQPVKYSIDEMQRAL